MIEMGSWIGLAAMTRSEITINVSWDNLGVIPSTLENWNYIRAQGDDIYIRRMKMGTKLKQILTVQFLPSQMRLGQGLRLIY
jgi:UDP-N-acetylglucosamine 1-carboxyvinyltransferase